MKKQLQILVVIFFVLSMSACGSDQSLTRSKQRNENIQNVNKDTTLIVYFSMPETTQSKNMSEEEENSTVVINGEVLGNTQYFASIIQEHTNASIFRIEPEVSYPTDHETLVEVASNEQEEHARPAIKNKLENLDQYDTVFVGYPNWWGDMPMILYSFFDEYDFTDKTIIPFNTHGGSGFSDTVEAIEILEQDANVSKQGLSISRKDIHNAKSEIIEWLDNNILSNK